MNILIKYHEKTSDENQMFLLDSSKHFQVITLEDNINNYTSSYVSPYTTPEPKINLSTLANKIIGI